MNLRVNDYCQIHGPNGDVHGPGAVIPESAVEGGLPEVDRLRRLGAVTPTDAEPTAFAPAARSAVAEMPDDELTRENARLKAELAARGDGHRSQEAELQRLRELLAQHAKPADLTPAGDPATKAATTVVKADPAKDPAAPPASLGPPVPGSDAERVARAADAKPPKGK